MAKKSSSVELKRIAFNLPVNLVERVQEYANNLGINVTSAVIVLLNQALEQNETMSKLPLLTQMYNIMQEINSKESMNSIITNTEKNID